MSDEYIRKADIINIPLPDKSERNYITYNHDDTYEQGYQEALDKAASLPPADVAPVRHGEWKWNYRLSLGICTRCGYGYNWGLGAKSYCPNCGAKMDGEKRK